MISARQVLSERGLHLFSAKVEADGGIEADELGHEFICAVQFVLKFVFKKAAKYYCLLSSSISGCT